MISDAMGHLQLRKGVAARAGGAGPGPLDASYQGRAPGGRRTGSGWCSNSIGRHKVRSERPLRDLPIRIPRSLGGVIDHQHDSTEIETTPVVSERFLWWTRRRLLAYRGVMNELESDPSRGPTACPSLHLTPLGEYALSLGSNGVRPQSDKKRIAHGPAVSDIPMTPERRYRRPARNAWPSSHTDGEEGLAAFGGSLEAMGFAVARTAGGETLRRRLAGLPTEIHPQTRPLRVTVL